MVDCVVSGIVVSQSMIVLPFFVCFLFCVFLIYILHIFGLYDYFCPYFCVFIILILTR